MYGSKLSWSRATVQGLGCVGLKSWNRLGFRMPQAGENLLLNVPNQNKIHSVHI